MHEGHWTLSCVVMSCKEKERWDRRVSKRKEKKRQGGTRYIWKGKKEEGAKHTIVSRVREKRRMFPFNRERERQE